jgi:hypothetical protein
MLPIFSTLFTPSNDQKYPKPGSINNNNFTQFFYTDDMKLAFLYDRTSRKAVVYTGYNIPPIADSTLSDF